MDPRIRELERDWLCGELSAGARLAQARLRGGQREDARNLAYVVLNTLPADQSLIQTYVGAGGAFVREVNHPILGPSFLYENLEVDGTLWSITRAKNFLDNGMPRTHDNWRLRAQELDQELQKQSLPGKLVIPNTKVETAIRLFCYDHHDHPALKPTIDQVLTQYRAQETNWPRTGTAVDYHGNSEATIEHIRLDTGEIASRRIIIPEYGPLILASEQEERRNSTQNAIPQDAIAVLEELFGPHYERAVHAFQYTSSRRNDNNFLRKFRFWTLDFNLN